MSKKTNIPSLDDNNTVWQLNWTEIAWPEADESELCTKDGRLFFVTHARDGTGLSPRMRMTEESALALANVSTKEEFLELHATGQPAFPAMATIKVVREINTASGVGADSFPIEYINFNIVSAADQPLDESPTQATLSLIPLMPPADHDSAAILPCPLHMVKSSAHYAFQIDVLLDGAKKPLTLPCQKIICLVKSTSNSKTEALGKTGFKVVTPDVECVLADAMPDGVVQPVGDKKMKFVLSSTCHVENITSYKLDPPRKGAQFALVTITNKLNDVFVVDYVQHLTPEEASSAKVSLWKLLILACHTSSGSLKRKQEWSEAESPAHAKQCRVLGRSPTAPEIRSTFKDLAVAMDFS